MNAFALLVHTCLKMIELFVKDFTVAVAIQT